MLYSNTNINTLPFYSTREEQFHRKRYANVHTIYIPTDKFIEIQLKVPISSTGFELTVNAYDQFDNLINVYDKDDFGFYISGSYIQGYNHLISRINEVNGLFEENKYIYLELIYTPNETTETIFYSDLFLPNSLYNDLIKVEYYNNQDIPFGDYIIKSSTFNMENEIKKYVFSSYFEGDIGKPKYPTRKVVSKRDDYNYPLVMTSNKEYTFPFLVNEPQMDALRLCDISDSIRITQSGNEYLPIDFEFSEVEWSDNGIGVCFVTFTIDGVIKRLSQSAPTRGDFNEDFNEDLNNL